MKSPLLVVCAMVAIGAALIGVVVVLENRAELNSLDPTTGLKTPATPMTHDLKSEASKTLTDLPAASKSPPWPKAVYRETSYAFGRMAVNATNEHTFKIRNEGEADLILKEGKPTCKCTSFDLESRTLKPGEETKLNIHWKASPSPDRAFRHGGLVYTNDPDSLTINYTVEGAIDMPVELLPNIWNVGNIGLEKTGTFRASVVSRLASQLEVESVECPSGKVVAKISPMSLQDMASEKWAQGFYIDLEIAADIPPGKFDEELTVHIKGVVGVPYLKAKLSARKNGSFILQPFQGTTFIPDKMLLPLGQFPAAEGRTAKLLLIVDQKDMTEPFQITEIEADPPFLKTALEPLGAATGTIHRYILTISVPPGRPHVQKTDTKRGHITLHTNHPSKETIQADILMHSH